MMDPFAVILAIQAQPWLAVLPAMTFAALWMVSRLLLAALAAVLWLIYSGYEVAMKARILCSGECNIRVDLLLIGPVLFIVTAMALGAFAWWSIRRPA